MHMAHFSLHMKRKQPKAHLKLIGKLFKRAHIGLFASFAEAILLMWRFHMIDFLFNELSL